MKNVIHVLNFTGPPVRITPKLVAAANAGMTHVVVAKEAKSANEFECCFTDLFDAGIMCSILNNRARNINAYTVEMI